MTNTFLFRSAARPLKALPYSAFGDYATKPAARAITSPQLMPTHRHPSRHPAHGPGNRNEAARFVTLIDTLYENKVKLLSTADAALEEWYRAGGGRFEFERTVSLLTELQRQDYLALGHGED